MPIARFQMPDGRIARFEVPEGTTPEQAQELVNRELLNLNLPKETPQPKLEDTGFFDMVGRAVTRGAKQTGSLLGDVLPAMAAKAVGAEEYAKRQMEEAAATQKEIEQKYGARYKELSDVKGLGDVLPFVAETVAEQIPNLATAVIPGVGGAGIGARVAAGQAAKTLAAREATEAGARYAAMKAAQGQAVGGGIGTYLGSYALNAPEVFQNIYEETGKMDVGVSALAGSVSAALDSVLPGYLLKQFTPGIKAGVVEKILERSGMPSGIARKAAAGAVTGAVAEGPTEAAQEAISILAEKFVSENGGAWDSKDFNRLVESGVRGAVGGAGISGTVGAGKGYFEKRAAQKAIEPTQQLSDKNAFQQANELGVEETTAAPPTVPSAFEDVDKDIPFGAPPEEPEVTKEEFDALLKLVTEKLGREPTSTELEPFYDALIRDKIRAQTPEDLFDEKKRDTGVDTGTAKSGISVSGGEGSTLGTAEGVEGSKRPRVGGAGGVPNEPAGRAGEVNAAIDEKLLNAGVSDEERRAFIEKYGIRDYTKPRFTSLTPEENALTQQDLIDAGIDGIEANYYYRQKLSSNGKKVNDNAKAAFAKAAANKKGGQGLLFAGPQQGLDFNAPIQEGPDTTPIAPVQQGLELAPAEGEVSREAPGELPTAEFNLARPEGVAAGASPETARQLGVDAFLNDLKEFAHSGGMTPEDRKKNTALFTKFFNKLGFITDPKKAAAVLSNPNTQEARDFVDEITKNFSPDALRREFNDFYNQEAIESFKEGYTKEKAALSLLDEDLGMPSGRVTAVLRVLENLPESARDANERAAANYFGTFNYNLAMKSAAFDIADQTPNGEVIKGQGARQAELFRNFVEENFPAAELEKFDALVDAYRTNLRKAASALDRYSNKQKKVAGLAALEGMTPQEIESHLSRAPLRSGKEAARKPLHPAIVERIRNNDLSGALAFIARLGRNSYYGALANRLLDMNLPTGIYFDIQQEVINRIAKEVDPTLVTFAKFLEASYPDVYQKYFADAKNAIYIERALKEIKDNKLVSQDVLDGPAFKLLFDTYSGFEKSATADGFYSPKEDIINLNRMYNGDSYYTLLHETIHAATAYAIRNKNSLPSEQQKAVEALEDLYKVAQKEIKIDVYGLTNLDEFIAEAFTSEEFQKLLKAIPYKNTDTSIWSKFIRFVLGAFGVEKNSLLFSALYNGDILMSSPRPSIKKSTFDKTLLGSKAPKSPKGPLSNNWQTAPDVTRNRAWLDSTLKGATWDSVKNKLPSWIENLSDTTRKYYLGAFTLRQLKDLVGNRIPQVGRFIDATEELLDKRNTILQDVSKITKTWEMYQSKNPEGSKKLSLTMIDATLNGIDPDLQPGKNAALDTAWDSLDEEAKEIYRKVRDFYETRLNAYRNTILKNVNLAMVANGKTDEEINQTLNELKDKFNKDTVKPYFPLKRFGKYWLQFGKGKDKEFYMFDSAGARNAFRKSRLAELESTGRSVEYDEGNDISKLVNQNIQDLNALKTLREIVDGVTENDPTKLKESIKDSLDQLYLLTLPDKSARKMFINRKQVQGASADMLRAFTSSAFHMAYQHSRFEHSRNLYEQIDAARGYIEGKPAEEKKVDRDYIVELEKRLEYIMNPTDTGTLPSFLSNASFIWYLTAPASALVNMMGVPAVGLPVVSARFGWGKSSAAMTSYAKRFMGTGFKNAQGEFEAPSLERANLSDVERQAYNKFVTDGVIDITLSHDLAGMTEVPSNLYTGRTEKVMRGLSYLFHNAEKFNREVVAMSSFKLAYDKALASGMSQDAAFEKATNEAKDLTYRSMFDYSTLNKPRYFQNAYAKVILQFKQFAQQMTYMLVHGTYEAFKGESPEVRREARDRVLGTLGMTFLFAGATGLPMFSIGASIIEALHAAFSDDDEPPLDFENWFKNWLAETFGNFTGDSISRGVITQATGINFADRLSLNDLWFRDSRKSQDEVTALQNMFINMLGPTAGLAINGAEALKLYNDGYYYRAAEKALPAFLKQPLVGARYATEGATTVKGDVLVEDISGKEAFGQMLGFAPERVAQRQKANIEMKTAEQEILNKRQDLMNAFFLAIDNGDDSLHDRVLDKINSFNRTYPGVAIFPENLERSILTRYMQRAENQLTGGTPITKKLRGQLGEMGYYGEPE
ncbi:MAG: PLxRFG domain-containing protein [Caulobacteraceae bacterium]|nr:PLxRFG domain-containing protein [Caulobacteraceae bacterium]